MRYHKTESYKLTVTANTSDDLYRYAWDGRVQAHGVDPYASPPLEPALARFAVDRFVRFGRFGRSPSG